MRNWIGTERNNMAWFTKGKDGESHLTGNNHDNKVNIVTGPDGIEIYVKGKELILPKGTTVAEAQRLIDEAKKKKS